MRRKAYQAIKSNAQSESSPGVPESSDVEESMGRYVVSVKHIGSYVVNGLLKARVIDSQIDSLLGSMEEGRENIKFAKNSSNIPDEIIVRSIRIVHDARQAKPTG